MRIVVLFLTVKPFGTSVSILYSAYYLILHKMHLYLLFSED